MKQFIKLCIKILLCLQDYMEDFYNAMRTIKNGKRASAGKRNDYPVFIMGNGPSLRDIDFNMVHRKCKLVCVNFYPIKSECFFEIKPDYYCVIDPCLFEEDNDYFKEKIKKIYDVLKSVDWDLTIITVQKRKFNIDNKHLHYEYISGNWLEYNGSRLRNYMYRNNYTTTGLQNVMNAALYYFIMKGNKNIYVSGLDMSEFRSYEVDDRNHVLLTMEHFYGNEKLDCTETGQIPKGEFYRWLGYYSLMLYQFSYTASFAHSQNARVTNCSLNSYVDVFDKKSWKELLNGEL